MKKICYFVLIVLPLIFCSCSKTKQAEGIVKKFAEVAALGDTAKMHALYPNVDFLNDPVNQFNFKDLADLQIKSIKPFKNREGEDVCEIITISKGKQVYWEVKEREGKLVIFSTAGLFEYDLAQYAKEHGFVIEQSLDEMKTCKHFDSIDQYVAAMVRMFEKCIPTMENFSKAMENKDTLQMIKLYPNIRKFLDRMPNDKIVFDRAKIGQYNEKKRYRNYDIKSDDYAPDDFVVCYPANNEDLIFVINPKNGLIDGTQNFLSAEKEKAAIINLDCTPERMGSYEYDVEYFEHLKRSAKNIIKQREQFAREEKARLEREAREEKERKAKEEALAKAEKERKNKVAKWESQGAVLMSHSMIEGQDGKGIKFSIGNLSNKTIKYVRLTVQAYNAVDDPIGYPEHVNGIGPVEPDEISSWDGENIWTYNPSIIRSYKIKSMTIEFKGGGTKTIKNPQLFPSDYKEWYY